MYLTNFPCFLPVSVYDLAIKRMVGKLRKQNGVVSIFQIGSINNPGISDIDMLVVFEDATECNLNPLEDLSKRERYLFSHNLFGVSKTNFSEAQRYTFFHNYNSLWGEELPVGENDLSKEEIQTLKTQTAFEYLLQMYITLTTQLTYVIVNVLVLLRHVRALQYDLQFLNVCSGELLDLINILTLWRNNWFDNKPSKKKLITWVDDFYFELAKFLKTVLTNRKFYLPEWTKFRIARNITLVPSEQFRYAYKGITLPSMLGGLGRKYFNIQHRFNSFEFQVPIWSKEIPDIIEKRLSFLKEMKGQNSIKLPHFMSMTPSLNIL